MIHYADATNNLRSISHKSTCRYCNEYEMNIVYLSNLLHVTSEIAGISYYSLSAGNLRAAVTLINKHILYVSYQSTHFFARFHTNHLPIFIDNLINGFVQHIRPSINGTQSKVIITTHINSTTTMLQYHLPSKSLRKFSKSIQGVKVW